MIISTAKSTWKNLQYDFESKDKIQLVMSLAELQLFKGGLLASSILQ